MRRILAGLLSAVLLLGLMPATATPARAQTCEFVLGFATLHDLIPDIVGDCVDNVSFDAQGNGVQRTTGGISNGRAGGLMEWRKADNFTAFTDGFRTWINGPFGLQVRLNTERFPWEADHALPADVAVVAQQGYTVFDQGTFDAAAPFQVLLGVRTGSADGYDQRAFFFHGGRFLGVDAEDSSAGISFVSQSGNVITLAYNLYQPDDAMFDPSAGRANVRFQFNGTNVTALDPIPSSSFTAPLSRR